MIIKIADENNESERIRLLNNPKGFAVTIDKDYLPEYFNVVENAISNLKRIINKYLKLYDTDKLPKSYPLPDYIANSIAKVGKENNKLKVSITVHELTVFFRLMKDCKMIDSNYSDTHAFIANNFCTDSIDAISVTNVAKLWSSKDPDVLTFMIRILTDMMDIAEKK